MASMVHRLVSNGPLVGARLFPLVRLLWTGGLALLLGLASGLAQQAVPPLTAHVVDIANTLDAQQKQALEDRLQVFEQTRGAQIAVLLVASTQPEDIASYANRVADSWKIGRREIGDGLLLVVAIQDRKVRIEVAKALEGAIPDLAAKRIIDDLITPRFKQRDYAGGVGAGVEQAMKLIAGEALPAPAPRPGGAADGFDWMDLAIFLFFAVPLAGAVARNILGPRLGALATGAAVGALALAITASLLVAGLAGILALLFTLFANFGRRSGASSWGSGGGGSSSSWDSSPGSSGGGGFSSGGGGDFGGGGASGDW